MVQKIGYIVGNVGYTGIAIVFVESKYVLLKEISEKLDFADLNLAVAVNEKEELHAIILHLYKSNTQIHQERKLSLCYKVNPTML